MLRSASALSLVLLTASIHAAAFQNGSFESATVDPVEFERLFAGSASVAGWIVESGNVDYVSNRYWMASDGAHSIDLSGTEAGSISQTFDTLVGRSYSVLFDMAGNPDSGPSPKTMRVSAAGASQAYSFDTTGRTRELMGWTPMTFAFTATSNATKLIFAGTTPNDYGPTLDNVRVSLNPVPEPSAFAAVGFGALALLRRRKRF